MLRTTGGILYSPVWKNYSLPYSMNVLKEYSDDMYVINENQAGFIHRYPTLNPIFLLKCVSNFF